MTQRPAWPTYEGRRLPQPDEELVDQGLAFDLGTAVSRRRLLGMLGLGAAGLGLAACGGSPSSTAGDATATASATAGATAGAPATAGTTATALAEIPDETAGPYPGDGSNGPDVLEQTGIVRSDLRSSTGGATGTADGVPMTLQLTVRDLARGGVPFEGVAVYVWHCDRQGRYSMYSPGVTGEDYLRGVQVADATGTVRFTSVFPACYSGRWPHIHFEVYRDLASTKASAKAIATSQVALPKDACDAVYATSGYEASVRNLAGVSLTRDNVFGDDGAASQLATVTGSAKEGYVVALPVGVDTTTTPRAGGRR